MVVVAGKAQELILLHMTTPSNGPNFDPTAPNQRIHFRISQLIKGYQQKS